MTTGRPRLLAGLIAHPRGGNRNPVSSGLDMRTERMRVAVEHRWGTV